MSGFVYIAHADRLTKIGYSKNPHWRISQMRKFEKVRPRLLAYVPGTLADERMVHEALAEYRLPAGAAGCPPELFRLPRNVLEYLVGEFRVINKKTTP